MSLAPTAKKLSGESHGVEGREREREYIYAQVMLVETFEFLYTCGEFDGSVPTQFCDLKFYNSKQLVNL